MFNYHIAYGDATSVYDARNWADACAFILHCLREGTRVRGITRTKKVKHK
jgi:hypothetical protein